MRKKEARQKRSKGIVKCSVSVIATVLLIFGIKLNQYVKFNQESNKLTKEICVLEKEISRYDNEIDCLNIEKERMESRKYIFGKIKQYKLKLVNPSPYRVSWIKGYKRHSDDETLTLVVENNRRAFDQHKEVVAYRR